MNAKQRTDWLRHEIDAIKDTYENTHQETLSHIRDMLSEQQYEELSANDTMAILAVLPTSPTE